MAEFNDSPKLPPGALNPDERKDDIEKAKELGVRLSDIFAEPDLRDIELETAAGSILLRRIDPEKNMLIVMESSDPSMKPGHKVYLDGASMSGGAVVAGILAPGARMAFRKKVAMKLKLGEKDEKGLDGIDTISPQTLDELKQGMPDSIVETEGGIEFHHFRPGPRATDFISHSSIVTVTRGEEKRKYLF